MGSRFTAIPVRDAKGDELTVYEIRDRTGMFGLIGDKRLELCTGELVEAVGPDTFVVLATGERLTRRSG